MGPSLYTLSFLLLATSTQESIYSPVASEQNPNVGIGQKGDVGDVGPPGPTGSPGPQGPVGRPGPPGHLDAVGRPGVRGVPGEAGKAGSKGMKGETGPPGRPGRDGLPGPRGHQGRKGKSGAKGFPGSQGPPGDKGEVGNKGLHGPKGEPCNCASGFDTPIAFSGETQTIPQPSIEYQQIRISKSFADVGDFFKVNESRFIAPVAGDYFFSVVTIGEGTRVVPVVLLHNGYEVMQTGRTQGGVGLHPAGAGRIALSLSIGDHIDVRVKSRDDHVASEVANMFYSETRVSFLGYRITF